MDSSNAKLSEKRLFIAVNLAASLSLIELYNDLKTSLGTHGIKWVLPNNFHITLKFLGATPEFYINSIKNAIKSSVDEITSLHISIKSIGYFGQPNPKILWAGIEYDKNFELLYEKLENSLLALGFDKEKRKFSPHLTLCRIKRNIELAKVQQVISPYKDLHIQTENINEITLFESILIQSGVEYYLVKQVKI